VLRTPNVESLKCWKVLVEIVIFLKRNFSAVYVGALMLFTTGIFGTSSTWIFNCALSVAWSLHLCGIFDLLLFDECCAIVYCMFNLFMDFTCGIFIYFKKTGIKEVSIL